MGNASGKSHKSKGIVKKKTRIDKLTKEDLSLMVGECRTINEMARKIGYTYSNGDKALRERLMSDGIDFSALDENMIKRRRRSLSDVSDADLAGIVSRCDTFAKVCFLLGHNSVSKSLIDSIKDRCDGAGIDTSLLAMRRRDVRLCARRVQTVPRDELIEIVKRNSTMTGVLADLGYSGTGRTNALKIRMISDGIDFASLRLSDSSALEIDRAKRVEKYEKFLVADSPNHGSMYKDRLIRDGLLVVQCYICGIGPSWNGLSLILQLDHINGVSNDNRLENLRLLCPNCHSQTDTYCRGRVSVKNFDECFAS